MDNVEIVEGAFHEILKRAQTGAPDAGLPVVRKPESWREDGIELTYHEGYTVRMRPAADDACGVDVFDKARRSLASEIVRGYDSPDALADRIEAIYAAARSPE